MKEKIKTIAKYLKKYLPDILFLFGVWISSYNLLRPPVTYRFNPLGLPKLTSLSLSYTEYFTGYKVLGVMLIAIGIDIAIRRYSNSKKK